MPWIFSPASTLKNKIYRTCFDIDTRTGRYIECFWIILTLSSICLVFIESSTDQYVNTYAYASRVAIYGHLEILLTIIFTVEYVLRLISTPSHEHYFFSFYGLIDLITILPIYLILFLPTEMVNYVTIFRLLRVLRLLRMIKLMRYMNSANDLWEGLLASYKKLMVFFFIILIVLCLFGGAMYIVEGPEHGFTSLMVSIYWAVVTMTTVGYGDITPHTAVGRVLASLLILIGYTIIAIPTGILTAHMTQIVQRPHVPRYCPQCHSNVNNEDSYCRQCGEKLDTLKEQEKKE